MPRLSSEQFLKHKEQIKSFTSSFGKAVNPSDTECDIRLNQIEGFIDNMGIDNFYWVVNLKEQRIERSYGVFRHLGYPDNPDKNSNSLTLFDIYYMVHEDMQEIIQAQRKKALPYLLKKYKGTIKPLSNDFIYKVIVCFVKKDGQSILVKQKSTGFQIDAEGNLLSYLSFHTIIRDYNRESPSIEITMNKERKLELEDEVQFGVAELIELPFTPREKQIIKVIADFEENRSPLDKTKVNNAKIIKLLKTTFAISISEETAKKHKRNILEKASEKYYKTFSEIRDLAIFLRNSKIL